MGKTNSHEPALPVIIDNGDGVMAPAETLRHPGAPTRYSKRIFHFRETTLAAPPPPAHSERDPSFLLLPRPQSVAVSHCATLVRSKTMRVKMAMTPFEVQLHVYDLSNGFIDRHSAEVTGVHVEGLYHSAVVCYGLEFFFEGGLAFAAAGRTRFGENYRTFSVGTTTKTLDIFLAWIRHGQNTAYRLSNYSLTDHNCHHFTRCAVKFLTGSATRVPGMLFSTVSELLETDIGAGVGQLMGRTIRGVQHVIARAQRDRTTERVQAETFVAKCARRCNVKWRPPVCVILFRVDDTRRGRLALSAILPFAEQLARRGVARCAQLNTFPLFAEKVAAGEVVLDAAAIAQYIAVVVSVLSHTPRALWGPVLNGLRIAVLHKSVLCACVFHPTLLGLLASGARDFMSLNADSRLGLLRVLCNLASGAQGAAALHSARYFALWVSAAGLAVADYTNTAIMHAGAALLVNMAFSITMMTEPSLSHHFSRGTPSHPTMDLVTILLFYLRHWPSERIPEAVLHLLLLALFVVASSCRRAVSAVLIDHSVRLAYDDLLQRAKTKESQMLVCLLHTLGNY